VRFRWVGLQRFTPSGWWPAAKRRAPDPDAMTRAERRAVLAAVAGGADQKEATAAVTGVPIAYVRGLMDDVVASSWIDRAAGAVWFYRSDARRSAAMDLPPEVVGLIYANDEYPAIYNCRECCACAGSPHHDGCTLAPVHAALASMAGQLRALVARCTCGAGAEAGR
jgi:hypothetical protein